MTRRRLGGLAPVMAVVALAVAGCTTTAGAVEGRGPIQIVAAENQYGDVAAQVGGDRVTVYSVESNPNTDPHAYEVTASVARRVARAALVVENGLGYDGFIQKLESATPSARRVVVDAQRLLDKPDSTPNPHLWYDPATMPAVADAVATDLSRIDPPHAGYYRSRAIAFDQSLAPWQHEISSFRSAHPGARAASTEPVADYLLDAMGVDNTTPFSFQAAIMQGTDPSPQDVATQRRSLSGRAVQVFVYNAQVSSPLTQGIRDLARASGVPIAAAYETMPAKGFDYQSWMMAETRAIENAVVQGDSSPNL